MISIINYWPISFTSVLMKVFERIIHRHLVCILEHYHLISPSTIWFQAEEIYCNTFTEAVDDWSLCIEKCDTMHWLLLDFCQSFRLGAT